MLIDYCRFSQCVIRRILDTKEERKLKESQVKRLEEGMCEVCRAKQFNDWENKRGIGVFNKDDEKSL